MILVDTGYFIALVSENDQHHRAAMAWTVAAGSEPLLVSEYVLVETINALSSRGLRQQATDIWQHVRLRSQFEFVPSTPAFLDAAFARFQQRMDKDWSLTDCAAFLLMEQRGIRKALSYDHHFEQAGFEAMLRRDP